MNKLLALADRVEACREGGLFSLDTEIAYALNLPLDGLAKPYTASLDAAVSLVPEGWGWMVSQPNERAIASGLLKAWAPVMGEVQYGCDHRHAVACATPALALVAASLRARAHGGGEG